MEDVTKMDQAATEAAASFPANGSATDVITWWAKWYNLAGHKRLGRIVVERGRAIQKALKTQAEALVASGQVS